MEFSQNTFMDIHSLTLCPRKGNGNGFNTKFIN